MLASKIQEHEDDFENNLIDSNKTKYDRNQEIIINTNSSFVLNRITPQKIDNYYFKEETKKTAIVLHLTCGFLKGDIATLVKQDNHVSVHFVLGRNGIVYQLFDTKYWAYHLGQGTIGGNQINSKRTISIEISNIGPLIKKEQEFNNIYNSKYCSINEETYYKSLVSHFRNYNVFSTCTPEQYTSLRSLLDYLCKQHDIPKVFINEKARYNTFKNSTEAQFKGICSHLNFRSSGKIDIGPCFDWNLIS